MTTHFPETMDFSGFNAPSRIECDINDLVVEGTIPAEISGSWFRLTPDPQFPPKFPDDTYLSGDGMISAFRIKDGHVDYSSRYIQTERFRNERAARRALYGYYRSPYTDDPAVRGKGRGVANTTPIWHGGKLLALKEDSHAVEIDPHSLETKGSWDYDGQLKSQTMTAHTRHDAETGDLYFFGYEAGGLATRDVAYCVADRNGELKREEWFQVPYCALMHDFAVTKEHVIFPVFPTTADLDRIKAGGQHWIFEPNLDSFIGIMPRDASVKHLRWFRHPACMSFHFMNAFTEGSCVHLDFGVANANVFPFIQRASNMMVNPQDLRGGLARWTFDLSKPGESFEEHMIGPPGDMPCVPVKDQMVDYKVTYYERFDPANGPPLIAGPVGAGFNTLSRLEIGTGKLRNFSMPNVTLQEAVHIPSKKPGHEGYLVFVADLHNEFLSDVIVLAAEYPDDGAIARIKMPFRLRNQVHGNWVPAEAL